jgi:hypothetical protein
MVRQHPQTGKICAIQGVHVAICYNACIYCNLRFPGSRKGGFNMTFAEADVKYEEIKQQFLAGTLSDEQFDDQLHRLMVLDDLGRWWAKSRENGSWHYFDSGQNDWVPGTPPVALPPPSTLPKQAQTPLSPAQTSGTATPQALSASSSAQELPKWATVKPSSDVAPELATGRKAGAANPVSGGLPSTAQGAPGTTSYSGREFSPLPELSSGMKVLFYILSLLLPVLGVLLYFIYRKKPNPADRSAARVFLILGILSIVFSCMCSTTFYVLESAMLGTTL